MNLEAIQERIDQILSRQENLERLVKAMQGDFLEAVLYQFKELATDSLAYDTFFVQFVRDYHLPILEVLAKDLFDIIESNANYFKNEVLVDDYIIQQIGDSLRESFGFTPTGDISPVGYLQDIAKDTSVKVTFKTQLIKLNAANLNPAKTKAELTAFIKGTDETLGVWESYFAKTDSSNSSVFDVYQKADRIAQNTFADELELNAAMYIGGLILGSRSFCKARNGKIFLRPEIAAWKTLEFSGKPKTGYEPFTDLGGYRCRHHLSWIGDSTAVRLDKTLYINANNKLTRK